MKAAAKRSILRWIHLVFGIPIVGYIYSPFEEVPKYAPVVVCRRSCNYSIGILDVERAMSFDDLFRKDGPIRRRTGAVARQEDQ
jgi:hypothetical protein